MAEPKRLPTRLWVIYQEFFGSWEIKGTATSEKERDQLFRYYDNIPGSGRTVWKEYQGIDRWPGLDPV